MRSLRLSLGLPVQGYVGGTPMGYTFDKDTKTYTPNNKELQFLYYLKEIYTKQLASLSEISELYQDRFGKSISKEGFRKYFSSPNVVTSDINLPENERIFKYNKWMSEQ